MKIEIFTEGKRHCFHLPLSRFALRLGLKLVLRAKKSKGMGQGSGERREMTAEEKASVIECVDRLVKILKDCRRKYGSWTLAECRDGQSGEKVVVTV